MGFSKTLYVEIEDIYIYQYKVTVTGKIYKFWKQIIKRMPADLKREISSKPTKLVEANENGTYRFVTEEASRSLKDWLVKFKILVNKKTKAEHE
jgi:hypothetical protein